MAVRDSADRLRSGQASVHRGAVRADVLGWGSCSIKCSPMGRRPPVSDQPVYLPPSILRSSRTGTQAPASQRPDQTRQPTFTIARRTDNELILFDEAASESWIIYPPRSVYEFLALRRRSATTTIVEHHPWTVSLAPVDHVLDPREGCLVHGLQCQAQVAIMVAVQLGYDPFA